MTVDVCSNIVVASLALVAFLAGALAHSMRERWSQPATPSPVDDDVELAHDVSVMSPPVLSESDAMALAIRHAMNRRDDAARMPPSRELQRGPSATLQALLFTHTKRV